MNVFLPNPVLYFLLFSINTICCLAQGLEISEQGRQAFLLGPIDTKDLRTGSYALWFDPVYEAYEPDSALIDAAKLRLKGVHFLLFLGTWCGDSKRQVPRMVKVLDQFGLERERLKLHALDMRPGRYKTSPSGLEKEYGIRFVPTLVVLKGKRELGRITENPVSSVEDDLLRFLLSASH